LFRVEQTGLSESVIVCDDLRGLVHAKNKERWKVLCEQAAIEQDPVKLHQLISEINDLLEAKEARLKGRPAST
jgi:hypothetical protein